MATATCSGTAARLGDARLKAQAQERHQAAAADAGAAARLLGDVAERLSTQIRPSLEGTVGSILASMSGGRFASVAISEDYDIAVEDDGQMRALSELSGGEVDLVALATRLALSQVVSDRHGAGGAGFLVLDECFGSQDPQRRASILDALRALRDTYSQIFLISHVENIEDSVDVVVTVTPSDDRSETDVTVS
jgi:DNA repair exonuclease SbcCD ATPase subunit